MSHEQKEKIIKEMSLEIGFDFVGIASAQDSTFAEAINHYNQWIQTGGHASMSYLERHAVIKENPNKFLNNWGAVICVGLLYDTKFSSDDLMSPRVSIYARGEDYHRVLKEKLDKLSKKIEQEWGYTQRSFVDYSPVLERYWAWRSGLGWIGKNTCLINKKKGSFLFLGGLFTTAHLQPDTPQLDHCGKCTKCIDACPTGAISEFKKINDRYSVHVVESKKCISYHNIENRGVIPDEIMSKMDRWIVGCDICQSICPWNDPSEESKNFNVLNSIYSMTFQDALTCDEHQFKAAVKDTAISRIKFPMFLRNQTVAIANSSLDIAEKENAYQKIEISLQKIQADVESQEGVKAALKWARTKK